VKKTPVLAVCALACSLTGTTSADVQLENCTFVERFASNVQQRISVMESTVGASGNRVNECTGQSEFSIREQFFPGKRTANSTILRTLFASGDVFYLIGTGFHFGTHEVVSCLDGRGVVRLTESDEVIASCGSLP